MASVINSPIMRPDARLYNIIQSLGLTTGLVLCLDAGDIDSYDGSSQTWTDRVGANNMFRGVDGSATGTDPTFNGVAGAKSASEDFSSDGGDFFKETAAHTYANDWHKNNGAFTLLALYYIGGSKAAGTKLFDTTASIAGNAQGIGFQVNNGRTVTLRHTLDDTPTSEASTGALTLATSSWNLVAIAFNEATPTLDIVVNGSSETVVPTASTATGAKATNVRIGAVNDTPNQPLESGERLACFAAWSTKLTTAQIGNIYSVLKSVRFTTLP